MSFWFHWCSSIIPHMDISSLRFWQRGKRVNMPWSHSHPSLHMNFWFPQNNPLCLLEQLGKYGTTGRCCLAGNKDIWSRTCPVNWQRESAWHNCAFEVIMSKESIVGPIESSTHCFRFELNNVVVCRYQGMFTLFEVLNATLLLHNKTHYTLLWCDEKQERVSNKPAGRRSLWSSWVVIA